MSSGNVKRKQIKSLKTQARALNTAILFVVYLIFSSGSSVNDARLGEQSDVVTNILAKCAPSSAMRSMFGVFRNGCPSQLMQSHRWSSVIMTTTLGLLVLLVVKCFSRLA